VFAGVFCEKPQIPINIPAASKSNDFFACIMFVLIFLENER
jgi:hypothetical protein